MCHAMCEVCVQQARDVVRECVERMISWKAVVQRLLDRVHRIVAGRHRAVTVLPAPRRSAAGRARATCSPSRCTRSRSPSRDLGVLGGVRDEQVEGRGAASRRGHGSPREARGSRRSDGSRPRGLRASPSRSARPHLGDVSLVMLRNATTTTIATRKTKLVTVVPSPSPPSSAAARVVADRGTERSREDVGEPERQHGVQLETVVRGRDERDRTRRRCTSDQA